jgi:hypothetical protein
MNLICRVFGHVDEQHEEVVLNLNGHAQQSRYWRCKRCGARDVHPLQSCGLDWLISTFGYWFFLRRD